METPEKIKQILNKIVQTANKSRDLCKTLINELEKLEVDTDNEKFEDVYSYLEGDCSAEELIKYLEEL